MVSGDEGRVLQEFSRHYGLDFKDQVSYAEKIRRAVERSRQKEALICGTGRIEGRPVVLGVLDFSFLGGSMGEVVGEKVSLACDLARQRHEPLVLFTSSGGARMHEGMLSLMQMAKTSAALCDLNESGGFSVCVLTNPTTYAVAIRYSDRPDRAPRVVAKGRGLIAARIREIAAEHDVPACEAPLLARAIYFNAEIGEEIPAGLYLAVARVLVWVMNLKVARQAAKPLPAFPTDLPVPAELRTEPRYAS